MQSPRSYREEHPRVGCLPAKPGALTRFCHNLSNGWVSINVDGMWGGRKVVERWMTNRLNPERSIFEASPKTSERSRRPISNMTSDAGISF
jgi:hypothetical protein